MTRKPEPSRRDFLKGKAALDVISDLPSRLLPPGESVEGRPELPSAGSSYLVQVARSAMACQFEVLLNAGQYAAATESAIEALDIIDTLEDQLSVYRSHSEISCINQLAGDQMVVVETHLFELLQLCTEICRQTAGAFDVTARPLTKVWGFHRRQGRMPELGEIQGALSVVGSQHLVFQPQQNGLQFQYPGMEIDLGAVGKGYALDRASEAFQRSNVRDYLLHGGQSTILARGSRLSEKSSDRGWPIGLRHPLRHEHQLAELWLHDRALATSGSGNQFFHFQGQRYGHVLDPRNGYPADEVLSATVLAPNAALADAISTAFFVMGVAAAAEYCETHPEIGALFVRAGERSGAVAVETVGFEDIEWRLLGQTDGPAAS